MFYKKIIFEELEIVLGQECIDRSFFLFDTDNETSECVLNATEFTFQVNWKWGI